MHICWFGAGSLGSRPFCLSPFESLDVFHRTICSTLNQLYSLDPVSSWCRPPGIGSICKWADLFRSTTWISVWSLPFYRPHDCLMIDIRSTHNRFLTRSHFWGANNWICDANRGRWMAPKVSFSGLNFGACDRSGFFCCWHKKHLGAGKLKRTREIIAPKYFVRAGGRSLILPHFLKVQTETTTSQKMFKKMNK
jgi:hypothetical protein